MGTTDKLHWICDYCNAESPEITDPHCESQGEWVRHTYPRTNRFYPYALPNYFCSGAHRDLYEVEIWRKEAEKTPGYWDAGGKYYPVDWEIE